MISSNFSRMSAFAVFIGSAALTAQADPRILTPEKTVTAGSISSGALQGSNSVFATADPVFYNNTTTRTAAAANGGATTTAGNTITKLIADDINLAGSQPVNITGFSFSVANFNAVAVSARPLVRFYFSDGVGGGPGTLLSGANFAPISFPASQVNVLSASLTAANQFVVPANTFFWAGITFDNNSGATGATVAQLNNFGQGIYNPPTVGASQDVFFQSTNAGSFASSNPAGSFFSFGGSPAANFGWRFTGTAVTPEPGAVAMLMGFGVSGLALLRRRKMARK